MKILVRRLLRDLRESFAFFAVKKLLNAKIAKKSRKGRQEIDSAASLA